MVTIRPISPDELDAWVGLHDRPDRSLGRTLRGSWQRGASRPEWCFLAEDGRRPVGRIGFLAEPVASTVPTLEYRVVGLWLHPGAPNRLATGRELLDHAIPRVLPAGSTLDATVNPEHTPMTDLARELLRQAGFRTFQEKEGFEWRADRPDRTVDRPRRLIFRSIEEAGPEIFAVTMARTVVGTLDRNDRHYRELTGPDGWGPEMLLYRQPGDGPSWLVGVTADGVVAGYVLIGELDGPKRGTIVHIGVVPDQRGNGYILDLLLAGNEAARRRGFELMLSDVDTENAPMLAAMERADHSAAATPWHVWHYRLER